MPLRLAALALLLAAGGLTTGCVAFPAYPIRADREATQLPERPGGVAAIEVSILRYLNERPRQVPGRQQNEWREFVAQAYRDLDVFDRLSAQGADLLVQVEIRDYGSGNRPLIVLSGLTLFLLPAWSSSDFVVTTRVRLAGAEAPAGESTVRYSYRSYYHLLLLPFATTNQETTVESEVIYGLVRKGLAEALVAARIPPAISL